ncbi:hypothetical protein HQ587_06030 [bacterium]|nr:hypothetical protein [bacterium]
MALDLDNANKLKELVIHHSRAGNPAFYAEAQEQGINLSDLFEQLDPSEPDSKLDAFERQLMLHGIESEGRKAISMEQFFVGGGLILLPEYILREVKRGYRMVQDPTDLLATVVHEPGPTVRPIYIKTETAKKSLAKRGSGGGSAYPRVGLYYSDKETNILDRGRQFDFSYRVARNQKLTEFRVFLWWIGAQMAYDEIDEIYNVMLNGDGTSAGAADVFDGVGGTFAYSDLVHLAMAFNVPARMTHILAGSAEIENIININELKDPQAWNQQELMRKSGDYRSFLPVNARLVIVPNAVATKVIGLDSRFAVRETVSQPLMIEAEKVINQKLESAVVSKESVYTIMVDGAAKLSDY